MPWWGLRLHHGRGLRRPTKACFSIVPLKAGYRNTQLLQRPKAHWEVSSLLLSQQHQGNGNRVFIPCIGHGEGRRWMEMGRAQLMPRKSCLSPCPWVMHKQPQAAALNRKSHLPHSKFKHCWSVPICLSKALSLWDLIPGVLLEGSAELAPSAGICWSEQGGIGNATSIGPARRAEELLWVLWSLLGLSAEGRLGGGVGLPPRTHFS